MGASDGPNGFPVMRRGHSLEVAEMLGTHLNLYESPQAGPTNASSAAALSSSSSTAPSTTNHGNGVGAGLHEVTIKVDTNNNEVKRTGGGGSIAMTELAPPHQTITPAVSPSMASMNSTIPSPSTTPVSAAIPLQQQQQQAPVTTASSTTTTSTAGASGSTTNERKSINEDGVIQFHFNNE
jgi:hypothetical protein